MLMEDAPMTQEQSTSLEAQLAAFTAQHPELVEAMRIFGLSNAQYARAIAALTHCPTVTTTSTTELVSTEQ
jgi:hypothetical protein